MQIYMYGADLATFFTRFHTTSIYVYPFETTTSG